MKHIICGALAVSLLLGASASVPAATRASAPISNPADTIYVGAIVTMAGAPGDPRSRAEAVAVAGERIIAVGSRSEVLRHRVGGTRVVELGSSVLLPGFIDAHGHLTATAATQSLADLSAPPVGAVRNIADIQRVLRQFIADRSLAPGTVVVGRGYDDAQLQERRHPTREDLDAVSTQHPILLAHVSGHLAAANSAMLALAGVDAATPDPSGGVIRRREGSREPNGVLEESAFGLVRSKVPQPPLLDEAGRRNSLTLDVVTYSIWSPVSLDLKKFVSEKNYSNRVKHYGIKLILDGSPQGKTAFLSQPYRVPPAGQTKDYVGYPTLPAAAVDRAISEAATHGIPVLAHANGDAAAQMLIDAVALAKTSMPVATPPAAPGPAAIIPGVVMIHAQTVRDDQLDRMAALGMTPSFFVGHTFYWGDWHREETLGALRADRISPTRSAIDRGLSFTLHTDTPVVPPDMLRTLWSATSRRTRSGDILGPAQRLTVWEALQGLTINAARQQGDGEMKGTIEVGKQADFVRLSADPLGTDPEALRELRVLETIARGRSVWMAQSPE